MLPFVSSAGMLRFTRLWFVLRAEKSWHANTEVYCMLVSLFRPETTQSAPDCYVPFDRLTFFQFEGAEGPSQKRFRLTKSERSKTKQENLPSNVFYMLTNILNKHPQGKHQ